MFGGKIALLVALREIIWEIQVMGKGSMKEVQIAYLGHRAL